MISRNEVIETNKMIEHENLDVRTITMGISLLDCCDSDVNILCGKIYDKILRYAGKLVKTGEEIEREFGVPIVNKRVAVTPIALVGGCACKTPADYVKIAKTLDKAAKEVGVNFLGGYSAIVSKGMTEADKNLILSIPEALAATEYVCSSVNVGSTKTGIDMDAVRLMGEVIKRTAALTAQRDSIGCAKLVVLCNAPDDNPFMAGAFHGVSEGDAVISVGVSGPGVVKTAIEKVRGADFETLCETIKKTAFKITRVGQLVAREASARLGIPFGIIDLSLAPTPAVGDSVAEILEEIGLESVGAPGTTAALAMLNDQVKKGGVMASGYVGGLSGAFIPVSEDRGMIDAVNAGALSIEKLEAMTCVCSVGLDMIAVAGDTPAATISGIIADEAAIGVVNQKTTAVRIIPVCGKQVGESVEFGGLLGKAPIMPVNGYSPAAFISRKGRIPAPIHSFKN
ncbi:MAG: PFL family protein [Clostridia bacterium]|nr:PFL family protein [Clostridia bacterium]